MILKMVCILAICAETLFGVKPSTRVVKGVKIQIMVNRVVPMMLKRRWIIVVRFATRLVPIEARTAVIQVPMF